MCLSGSFQDMTIRLAESLSGGGGGGVLIVSATTSPCSFKESTSTSTSFQVHNSFQDGFLVYSSSNIPEENGSGSDDDSSEHEYVEEVDEGQDYLDSGSDASSEDQQEEEEEGEEEEEEEEEEQEEKEEEEEDDGRLVLVSVIDKVDNPADSSIAGTIKLDKCSNHGHLRNAIRKILAKYANNELNTNDDDDNDDNNDWDNVWPGYTFTYYSYDEKELPSPSVMGWEEVADLLGSILAKEENKVAIELVDEEEGNLENIDSFNLNECHDHDDLIAVVHGAWVKYTGNEPRLPDTDVNEATAWPGYKVTYLQHTNYYPNFDPSTVSWSAVKNLLYKVIVEKELEKDYDETEEEEETDHDAQD